MNTTRRGRKILALAAASAVIFAACGSDDDSGSSDTSASDSTEAATEGTEPADDMTETTDDMAEEGEEPAGEPVFRITYNLSENAVWEDGTPISAADFECARQATIGTPGSLSTVGYESITSISEGDSPSQVVVEMDTVFAAY